MARLLIVEDEVGLMEFLRLELSLEGNDVAVTETGADAIDRAQAELFDAVLLDIALPDMDGFLVCRRIRSRSDVPIIMLTARSSTADKVAGLDAGADDYLVKPFTIEELNARLRAVWRRKQPVSRVNNGEALLNLGELTVQLDHPRVFVGTQSVEVTLREFELLVHFMRHPERVFSREELLRDVWGYETPVGTNVVDVYVGYLRQKIDQNKRYIHTVRGSGYSFYEAQP